jgi:hypothetical protein
MPLVSRSHFAQFASSLTTKYIAVGYQLSAVGQVALLVRADLKTFLRRDHLRKIPVDNCAQLDTSLNESELRLGQNSLRFARPVRCVWLQNVTLSRNDQRKTQGFCTGQRDFRSFRKLQHGPHQHLTKCDAKTANAKPSKPRRSDPFAPRLT